MFCWETLGPDIHVEVTLTRTNQLIITADKTHPLRAAAAAAATSTLPDLNLINQSILNYSRLILHRSKTSHVTQKEEKNKLKNKPKSLSHEQTTMPVSPQ